MSVILIQICFGYRRWQYFIAVPLFLRDLLIENDEKAMKWRRSNFLRDAYELWIIISARGSCDGKITGDKVDKTLEKRPKPQTFELYFARFIDS